MTSPNSASPHANSPFPFVPLLKSVILLMPLTISLQGVAIFLRSLVHLREG